MWTRREAILACASAACVPAIVGAAEPGVPPADRELRVPVRGGSLYVRVNGDLAGPRPPLLMVHGGPGGALWQFFPALPLAADRAIILYDQLDSGRSDSPGDPSNWTVDRYVSEIEAVRSALKIKDFHLLGHSWGGILANRYAAARPRGLKSLILQGAPLSDRRLEASVRELYGALPNGLGAVLLKHEQAGTMDNSEYGEAFAVFLKKHLRRTSMKSVGLPYMSSLPEDRGDALAKAMVGGKISGFEGRLKALDDEPLLARIAVPTLVLFGQYDIMTRAAEQAVARRLRNGTIFEIADAGHMAQFDQPEAWRGAIAKFLSAHDR